jgi:phage terminase large subunit-like protein
MTLPDQAQTGLEQPQTAYRGVTEPRIWTKSPDLPSYGIDFIEWCASIGFILLPWQEFLAHEICKVTEDDKWFFKEVGVIISRQNGKSTFMQLMILWRMFALGQKLQVHTAHKLTTSSEIFWKIDDTIQSHAKLVDDFGKKYESKGSQEIKLKSGGRYLVRANNSASRGIAAPDTIYMDEVREFHDDEVWSSLRYTQMATPNPQTLIFSNAGDQHSIVLNRLRERGLAAAAGADDRIGWFEWSAEPGCDIRDKNAWMQANPSAGYTISLDNLEAAMSDEESIVRTELLCQWVSVVNPAINPSNWAAGIKKDLKLDREALTWMAIDLSPNRQEGSLVAAQQEGDNINVVLLQTWTNPINLDAKQIANDVADWVRKFQTETVAYSRQTSGAVAALLSPAGISTTPIDGALYGQACDEMLSAITSGRLFHGDQDEFTRQVLSAVKLPFKDGGWYLGRKVSNATICAAVSMAMVCHFATRGEAEYDIVVG